MTKFFLSIVLAGLLVLCFSQEVPDNNRASLLNRFQAAEQLYERAEKISSTGAAADETRGNALYTEALGNYLHLIPLTRKAGYDSLCFFLLLRSGYIYYYFDSLDAAKTQYAELIALQNTDSAIADSFLFKPYLFTGSIYYSQNEFDSALVYYKQAEAIRDQYNVVLEETPRLYNRLGVMYYQDGNYQLAKNYFEKAISVLDIDKPEEKELMVNYRINIGSLLIKLEEFEQARMVYLTVLSNENYSNEIYHNLGIIDLNLHDPAKAIDNFRKVNYGDTKRNIDLYYNYAMAFSGLQQADSAKFYADSAIRANFRWNGITKNVPYGLLLKYQGDQLASEQRYYEAIRKYQEAAIQFDTDFDNTDIYQNPDQYSGVISFINLFNVLVAKADAFELMQKDKNVKALQASLSAYRSAFKLADFVERTYESDEARLFLNKIKYTAHSKPIKVSLELFDLTRQPNYLEEAYLFDQRNKASILSLNVRENELRSSDTWSRELMQQESAHKSAITRLSLQAARTTDSSTQQQARASIRDHEIELSKLQQRMNANPAWQKLRAAERIPATTELQQRLDEQTAILSYHLSDAELLTLVITAKEFTYHSTPLPADFFSNIDSLKSQLYTTTNQRYNAAPGQALYQTLIDPIQTDLSGKDRLIIIPDDELNYLPFEALQNEEGDYLLARFSVQYQYSTALLERQTRLSHDKKTLAFAPFVAQGYNDSLGSELASLPSSREEIGELQGALYFDATATKEKFLSTANQYNILHLATHATVNNQEPARSFIAFYPDGNKEFRLYAQEIYDMKLDSTQLVILSACETASGQLIKGEGMMSLSRAFAYAGCPNIIASLWKAEDQSTAYITKRLYYYLDRGDTKDKALQKARLDLLNSDEIDARHKTPAHWAHLVFIGQYEQATPSTKWLLIAALAALLVAVVVLVARGRYYY